MGTVHKLNKTKFCVATQAYKTVSIISQRYEWRTFETHIFIFGEIYKIYNVNILREANIYIHYMHIKLRLKEFAYVFIYILQRQCMFGNSDQQRLFVFGKKFI